MKKLLTEWKKHLFAEGQEGIQYKAGYLADLLKEYPKIKRLRVPSWFLQSYYPDVIPSDVACIALDDGEPVGIAAIVTPLDYRRDHIGLLNLYVDSWHRDMGLATNMFEKAESLSKQWEYIVGSRTTKKMLQRRNRETADFESRFEFEDSIPFKNPNHQVKGLTRR
jgi:GNAT superfamily N-acetyltransferase